MPAPPLIAVTTSEMRAVAESSPKPEGDPKRREMALGMVYLEAIERAGGIPVVVPPLHHDAIGPLLDKVDGIVLSGGPDLDPVAYGQLPHPMLGETERRLDEFELALAKTADARELPVLAICRGAQAINVARGGTLFQHLPDAVGESVPHRQTAPGTQPTHAVRLAPGSRLAAILGTAQTEVNSFHHQAVQELGARLTATGWAPDGTIEAFEADDRRFLVAVQWHAETLVADPQHERLFTSFVAACAGRPATAAVARAAAGAA